MGTIRGLQTLYSNRYVLLKAYSMGTTRGIQTLYSNWYVLL